MSAAPLADPELIRLPRRSGGRVAHIHLIAAALAAHFYSGFGHARNSIVVRLLTVIPGIVLAGGKSSRMGRPKALLPIGSSGETFFDRVTRTLIEGGVQDVVVVVGADADVIRAGIAPASLQVRLVTNPDFERGQLTSLLAGLRTVDRPGVSAALVTLIDSPLISADDVRRLI